MSMDYAVPVTCNMCNATREVRVNKSDYEKWIRREGVIQELLHYLSKGERELLISGTCNDCFNKLFWEGEEEDEEEED